MAEEEIKGPAELVADANASEESDSDDVRYRFLLKYCFECFFNIRVISRMRNLIYTWNVRGSTN